MITIVVFSVDELVNRKMGHMEILKWIDEYDWLIQRECDENHADPDLSFFNIMKDIHTNDKAARIWHLWMQGIARMPDTSDYACYNRMIEILASRWGQLVLVIGGMGMGKTTLIHSIVHDLKTIYGIKSTWFGIPAALPPFYSEQALKESNIPNDRFSVSDEAGIVLFSRTANDPEQMDIIKSLPITRQKNRSIIFLVQNPKLLDVNVIRMASSVIFLGFETFNSEVRQNFKLIEDIQLLRPKFQGEILMINENNVIKFNFSPPVWWKEEYSKPFRHFRNESEKYRFILSMIDQCDDKQISKFLHIRSCNIDEIGIAKLRNFINYYGKSKLEAKNDADIVKIFNRMYDDTPLGEPSRCVFYNFHQTPIQRIYWEEILRKNERWQLTSCQNINPIIEEEIKQRLINGNIICSFKGKTGTGKSQGAIALALIISKVLHKTLTIKNITYNIEEIYKLLETETHDTVVVHDEQITSTGIGSQTRAAEFKNMEETLRKKRISFIFSSPELHQHIHNFTLETFAIDHSKHVSKMMVFTDDELIGYITLRQPPEEFLVEYEKHKDAFLKKITSRKVQEKPFSELADKIIADPMWELCKNIGEKDRLVMKRFPHLSSSEIQNVTSEANLKAKAKQAGISY